MFALLPAWLMTGCVSAVAPAKQNSQPAAGMDDRLRSTLDMALLRSVLERGDEAEDLFIYLPIAMTEARGTEKPPEKKEPKVRAKQAAQTPPDPPTALQEAVGPEADDRLLGLWQKDLDDAMQQPAGRRKIHFSIPLVENDRVRYFVDYFSGKKRDFFEVALARSGKYIPMMAAILQQEGLPEDLVYLSLIESGFSVHALSRAKALGPWQFIKDTGLRYGLKINRWLDERKDPVKATRAAAAYLKDLHQLFGEWFLAAAAYNAGERKVEKAVQRYQTDDFWRLSQKSYLKSETRNYVPKFIAAAMIASAPEKYGFAEIAYEPPMEYDEVTIHRALRLDTVAKLANATVKIIRELNPALLRNITPPNETEFLLRVPRGSGEAFAQAYGRLPESATPKMVTHRVKKGDTLLSIAKRYRQRVAQLMELNGLRNRQLRVGQELIVILDGEVKKK
jgi:membrane-bound lytic murein transglycosylase D